MPESSHYAFFSNTQCEYFPCHPTDSPKDFNCLFCYCPLYALGARCGGNYSYTPSGIKDCSGCMLPHKRKSYPIIIGRFREIQELAAKNGPTPDKKK